MLTARQKPLDLTQPNPAQFQRMLYLVAGVHEVASALLIVKLLKHGQQRIHLAEINRNIPRPTTVLSGCTAPSATAEARPAALVATRAPAALADPAVVVVVRGGALWPGYRLGRQVV